MNGSVPGPLFERSAALYTLRGLLLLDPEILETFDIDCC